MALYGGRSTSQLTLGDGISTGFRMVTQLNFMIPMLVIGVIINLVVLVAIAPLHLRADTIPSTPTPEFIVPFVVSAIAGFIGTILLNLYGQVWAVMASVGEAPTFRAALARVGQRWISILGAGIATFFISLGLILAMAIVGFVSGAIVFATMGENSSVPYGFIFLLVIVAIAVLIFVAARLSLATWLAAEGLSALGAVSESWRISRPRLWLIIGWNIVFGLVFGIVGLVVSIVLGFIPVVGSALATTITTAFGYGSGVTLFRKVRDGSAGEMLIQSPAQGLDVAQPPPIG